MNSNSTMTTLLLFYVTLDSLKNLAATDGGVALDVLSMMTRELQQVSDSLALLPAKRAALKVIQ